ncbi:adenylate/guanylate cyclase catalytic domain protein [Leptospira inadai serovar Lyme str. 10]|uniref:Adenylate/guanylate cyclase catalytic domain protein n=2 Tax=Leptospira inadai serovar Lyme TaxID=293084 RepID=V6H9Q5_9LEPT|nr:adenylate/guanylate cyclase domain-containing protein [Leptospira inadai]EQA34923.1 adenylate/guanylate cyclase catalytic domain protein [Leptospira inadai serovar Lyme str. 10]PNV73117.1 adenylate/guanylate cyclase domain-containing protein [Leptospira inadai serovar Lyme]
MQTRIPSAAWETLNPQNINLTAFLEAFPWETKWTALANPIDRLWKFDLNAIPTELWPWLVDTSSFNKRIGVPEMKFQEVNGKLFGTSKNAGIPMEWEEVPWEWEYCKQLNNARIYSKGFAHYVRTRYLLFPLGEDRSRLFVYFGWIPKGFIGKNLLPIGMKQLEKSYLNGLMGVIEDLKKVRNHGWTGPTSLALLKESQPQKDPIFPARVQQIRVGFIREGQPRELVNKVLSYIFDAEENDLYRIRVKSLAKAWDVPFRDLLLIFLHGCRLGLFTLSWDIICPHCRGVRTEAQHLGDLPTRDNCDVCEIQFDTNQINSVEITFHVHPSVREIQKRYFCAAEPATKSHIRFQKYLQPNESYQSHLLLHPGTYRLRINGEKRYSLLDVTQNRNDTKLEWATSGLPDELEIGNEPTFILKNTTSERKGFIIEERKEDQDSLRPSDLFNFQNFRELFSQEALSTELQLDIGIQTILFTDIVGSTRFYHQKGDTGAFAEVRQHFVEVYKIVRERHGAVVKTIGDAVMASFTSPVDAVIASTELQEYFSDKTDETPIRIRISLHSGPCLAVNLNSNIDYFGNTVNFAAKLQGVTEEGEIVFSEGIFRDKEIRELMKERSWKVKKVPFHQSWIGEETQVYKLVISPPED